MLTSDLHLGTDSSKDHLSPLSSSQLLLPCSQGVVIPGDNLVRAQKTSMAVSLSCPCAVNEGLPVVCRLCALHILIAITQTHKH